MHFCIDFDFLKLYYTLLILIIRITRPLKLHAQGKYLTHLC